MVQCIIINLSSSWGSELHDNSNKQDFEVKMHLSYCADLLSKIPYHSPDED